MKLRRICSTAKPEPSPSAGSALAPSPPPTICRSGVVLADRRDGRGSEMALAERGSGLASSGLAHQHGRDELGHGTHGFGFYKAGVHGFRFYRTSDLTRCENWPPDRISRSWLPLTVARADPGDPLTTLSTCAGGTDVSHRFACALAPCPAQSSVFSLGANTSSLEQVPHEYGQCSCM